jgi:hypothetical protein
MKVYNWLSGLRPRMIEVHHYRVLDPATGNWVVAPLKCTAQDISRLEGLIIAGTMEIVAHSSLDKDGCYDPKQSRNEPAWGTNLPFRPF